MNRISTTVFRATKPSIYAADKELTPSSPAWRCSPPRLAACATMTPASPATAPSTSAACPADGVRHRVQSAHPPEDSVSFWDGDGVPGTPHIEVRLGEQRAYFYKGDQLVGVSQVSTGQRGLQHAFRQFQGPAKGQGSPFQPVRRLRRCERPSVVVKANVENGKDPKPPGTMFLGSSMPFFLRVTNGVGLHAGYLPGVPASHGCIRMPEFMAQNFFYNTPMGTPVTISN